jgi:hypothetical protein
MNNPLSSKPDVDKIIEQHIKNRGGNAQALKNNLATYIKKGFALFLYQDVIIAYGKMPEGILMGIINGGSQKMYLRALNSFVKKMQEKNIHTLFMYVAEPDKAEKIAHASGVNQISFTEDHSKTTDPYLMRMEI